ncbi:diacylglycerol/lipid kinase family protein [Oscillospiraceae bacterium LTW-04]|nr:diacylglycerol kinase family lipid kinase [Oscillospiraceae bacterium MB24-C1]
MRHIFILNPKAGKADSTPALKAEIQTLFSGRSEDYEIVVTQSPGHAEQVARRFAADGIETTLYACGGDGTIGEVAQALPGNPQLILAPVPAGTGNDFVRGLEGLPDVKTRVSLSSLMDGQVVPLDLLMAGDRVSINIASVGLDATIAQNMARFKHLPLIKGQSAYILSLIYCFFTSVRYRYRFEIDGVPQPEGDCIFAIAANGRYYGGGFMAAPLADWQDGLIDFIIIPAMPRLRLLPMITTYKRGEHLQKYDFIRFVRCKQVRILSDKPVALNCDGEIASAQNFDIKILPGAARLLVPRAAVVQPFPKEPDKMVSCMTVPD